MRDRQLDTVHSFSPDIVENIDHFIHSKGQQYKQNPNFWSFFKCLKNFFPLPNLKLRPKLASSNSTIYTWGAIVINAEYIVELDNPWALTGYSVISMYIYKWLLKYLLSRHNCKSIVCISRSCQISLELLFGNSLVPKTIVRYPTSLFINSYTNDDSNLYANKQSSKINFLMIGSQFLLKGVPALIMAFQCLRKEFPDTTLTVISNYPNDLDLCQMRDNSIFFHRPIYSREELICNFIDKCDILVHPSLMESFGMVVYEAMLRWKAIIATPQYAITEFVYHEYNGLILNPPISSWLGYYPSKYFKASKINSHLINYDWSRYSIEIFNSMLRLCQNPYLISYFQSNSRLLSSKNF